MILDKQTDVSAFLAAPETHGIDGAVEVIDTHISRIFLAGNRAYKLKRAVLLPYADFSTPEIRLATCEKEYTLNAPGAPAIYLGVRRITREADATLAFDGRGDLVDAVVEMTRFDQEGLLDRVAEAGGLTADHIADLAHSIEALHARAPVSRETGGAANMAGVLDINLAGFATSRVFSRTEVATLDAKLRCELARHAGWLDRRALAGMVRRCHGDLHLRNICLFDGRPQIFDCIDFNDTLATVDVLYDLAFLLMDLWHRGMDDLTNRLANRYFDETGSEDGFGLLPFFMAVRAEVRAHVTATAAEGAGADRARLAALAREYFELALTFLDPVPPRIVALGGLSGSGKTTIAEALAPGLGRPPGARVLESDRLRKAMFGVLPEDHLPPEDYAPEISDEVYRHLAHQVHGLADAGISIVAGAVFTKPSRREALEHALADRHLTALWLDVEPDLLRRRIATRAPSASDAGLDVLERQLERIRGPIVWPKVDANGTVEETLAAVSERVGTAAG